MFRSTVCLVAAFSALGINAWAQAPGGSGRGGGRGRGPAIVSPQVNPDHTITLRFRAPNAKEVVVIGEIDGKNHPMTKDASGVWSATIGPLAPDVYNYQFQVDGVIAMDPQNPSVKLGFGAFPPANLVEVPGDGAVFDDVKPVPHGTVRFEIYDSKTVGAPRTLWIYTPPGYDKGNQKYPVFYLLHGSGNIDSSWVLTGRENIIMDNLIAEGKTKPMIIVNPLGYVQQGVGLGPVRAADATATTGRGGQGNAFGDDLIKDVIPYIEKNYRVLKDADHRALGGLSMGGGQTVSVGFPHTDLFHTLVIMSAGAQNADKTYPMFFDNPAATNKTMKLVWLGVGKDDNLVGPSAKALEATLVAKGIRHVYSVSEGRHEWVVWRHALYEVAPQMFR
ncbi:MAG TPA: alpha/beta hydrolase-fold protein [Bryobacteraceae bacterium]|nr:alpha/beta hydrolase-fold protein [Bryobacteraceae bacterium]